MTKRAFVILMTVMLGLAGVLGPASYAMAQDKDKGILEQGAGIGQDLYEKMDHRGFEPLTSRLRTWRSPS